MKKFDLKNYLNENPLLKKEDGDTLNEFFGKSKKKDLNPYKTSVNSVDDLPPGYKQGNVVPYDGEDEEEDNEERFDGHEVPGIMLPFKNPKDIGNAYDIIVKKFRTQYDAGVFDIRYDRTDAYQISRFTHLHKFPHSLHIKVANMSQDRLHNFHNLIVDVLKDGGLEMTFYMRGVDDRLFKGSSLGARR